MTAQAQEPDPIQQLELKTRALEKKLQQLKREMAAVGANNHSPAYQDSKINGRKIFRPYRNDYTLAGMPVVAMPFIGRRPGFDSEGALLYNSYDNQDIRIMRQRNEVVESLKKNGETIRAPIITLNGIIEPLFTYGNSFSETGSSNINLASVVLNTNTIINPWVGAVTSLTASSQPISNDSVMADETDVQMSQAYVNIGNIKENSLYASAGQLFVPFGQQYSNMVSFPLSSILNTTKATTVVLGKAPLQPNDLYGAIYTFNSKNNLNNSAAGGANLAYTFKKDTFDGNVGASIISSIGDASGFQTTTGTNGEFAGFNTSPSNNSSVSQVPGGDIYGLFRLGRYSLISEYTTALYPFSPSALSYNGGGAQPSALNLELARGFSVFNKPSSFSLGYGWSGQALALQIPQQTFRAIFNISLWPRTLEALEFEHNINYGSGDYASGVGSTTNTNGTGSSSDVVEVFMSASF